MNYEGSKYYFILIRDHTRKSMIRKYGMVDNIEEEIVK